MRKIFLRALICAAVILSVNSVATAANNLWRCTRCNGQIQTSDTSKPKPGSCPHGGGHDWILVK